MSQIAAGAMPYSMFGEQFAVLGKLNIITIMPLPSTHSGLIFRLETYILLPPWVPSKGSYKMRFALLTALLSAGFAQAEMVTFSVSGKLNSASDPNNISPFPLASGTPFVLTAKFDRAASPVYTFITEARFALQSATLKVGNTTLSADTSDSANNFAYVNHDPSFSDTFGINIFNPGNLGFRTELRENTGTLFSGLVMPDSIDFTAFDTTSFDGQLFGPNATVASFGGSVAGATFGEGNTVVETPEPGSLVLLATGALGLLGASRRRQSRR